MRRVRVVWTALARAELDEVVATIAFHAGRATGAKWKARFRSAAQQLSEHPLIGQTDVEQLGPGKRRWVIAPYLLVYRLEADDAVTILRVVHGARDLPQVFGVRE